MEIKISTPSPNESKDFVKYLSAKAESLSSDTTLHLQAIIENLLGEAFSEQKILANEFLLAFEEGEISKLLVDKFLEKTGASETAQIYKTKEASIQEAQIELAEFIKKYPDEKIETLNQRIKSLKQKYANLSIKDLFDEKMRALLNKKISEAAEKIAKTRFTEIYKSNPAKFFQEYVLPRIITFYTTTHDIVDISQENLTKLLEFLSFEEKLDENVLYEEILKYLMKNAVANQVITTEKMLRKNSIDVTNLCDRVFHPTIKNQIETTRKMKTERTRKKKGEAHQSPININQKGMSEHFQPEVMVKTIKEILEANDADQKFLLSRFFTCNQEDLDDLPNQLKKASKQLKLTFRKIAEICEDKDKDNMTNKLSFEPEITSCREIITLLKWWLYPEKFMDDKPEASERLTRKYGKINAPLIMKHQARKMVEFFLLYRKCAFYPQVKKRKKDKKRVEKHFKEGLEMREEEQKTITFRIKENLNDDGSRRDPGSFEVVKDGEILADRPTEEIRERNYIYYPIEKKNFTLVTVDIPIYDKVLKRDNGHKKTMKLWIYTGDKKEVIHHKRMTSILSNFLREGEEKETGKEKKQIKFRDLVRWTVIPDDPNDYAILQNFLISCYTSDEGGDDAVKIITPENGSKSSSSAFPPHHRTTIYGHANIKKDIESVKPGKKRKAKRIDFETQILKNIDDLLKISLSEHTPSSYKKYNAKRELPIVKKILHPPVVYGTESIETIKEIEQAIAA